MNFIFIFLSCSYLFLTLVSMSSALYCYQCYYVENMTSSTEYIDSSKTCETNPGEDELREFSLRPRQTSVQHKIHVLGASGVISLPDVWLFTEMSSNGSFQILDREPFDSENYTETYLYCTTLKFESDGEKWTVRDFFESDRDLEETNCNYPYGNYEFQFPNSTIEGNLDNLEGCICSQDECNNYKLVAVAGGERVKMSPYVLMIFTVLYIYVFFVNKDN